MTEHEQIVYCGTITLAARRMGIVGRMENDYFTWADRAVSRSFRVGPIQDKKQLLQTACETLSRYLTPHHMDQATKYKL